jgi:hypothetical protein
MGLSGKGGTVLFGVQGSAEVTKWNLTESAYKKEFGHDKSAGWQDVCYGIKKCSGTVDVMLTGNCEVYAGQKVNVELIPDSESGCITPITGKAGIDSVAYNVDVTTGDPISATISISSVGEWTGLPGDGKAWGGFEDGCG